MVNSVLIRFCPMCGRVTHGKPHACPGGGERMMDVVKTLALLGVKVPHWKLHAMQYLESIGQQFCVDYGYDNAVEKAREHWRNRRKRRGKRA